MRGLEQADRGEGIPHEEVMKRLGLLHLSKQIESSLFITVKILKRSKSIKPKPC